MAIITTSTCLSFSSPTASKLSTCLSFSSPTASKLTQIEAIPRNSKDSLWRKQCVVGMACMIIGVQIASIQVNDAIAKDMEPLLLDVVTESKQNKIPRWSDKRMCPPWRGSSLETIVPENLPRPSAHRRYETVRYPNKNSPMVKGIVRININGRNDCFSM